MLPSQSARPSSSRSHMYRRHRSRKLPLIIISVTALIVFVVVFKWMAGGGEPSNAQADVPTSAPDTKAASLSTQANEPKTVAAPQQQNAPRESTTPINPPVTQASMPATPSKTASNTTDKISMGGALPAAGSPSQTTKSSPAASADLSKPANVPNTPPPSPPVVAPPTKQASTNQPAATQTPATTSLSGVAQRMNLGFELLTQNRPLDARTMLTQALESPGISKSDAERIRTELTKLNQRLIFGPEILANDPHVLAYTIESGDSLAKITKKLNLKADWRFLQRINNISDPARIRVGQRIKAVKGPFHAVVDKPAFRMDLFLGDQGSSDRTYVQSFPVGLGEFGATPEGAFIVKSNSKLIDPAWTNPRTGEFFASGDPKNPLGKRWIGLIGVSDNIRDLETYGIHGTVEPDSIGQLRSMGCVRMRDDDVALVYEVMIENVSRVEIHGEDYP